MVAQVAPRLTPGRHTAERLPWQAADVNHLRDAHQPCWTQKSVTNEEYALFDKLLFHDFHDGYGKYVCYVSQRPHIRSV